mmetsp:Transcript_15384/g.48852  ORF Transcript_15384/g.48852 Transcript_15384/m.48852 type:complete len:365 (+) Transcript_15384:265-1359(+)|eukprot:scaffold6446_cov104-Isochrysis_galbana.AAC.16
MEHSMARGSINWTSVNSAPPLSHKCGPSRAPDPPVASAGFGQRRTMSSVALSPSGGRMVTRDTSPPASASVASVGAETDAAEASPSCQKTETVASKSMAAVCSRERLGWRGHDSQEGTGSIASSPGKPDSLRHRSESESSRASSTARDRLAGRAAAALTCGSLLPLLAGAALASSAAPKPSCTRTLTLATDTTSERSTISSSACCCDASSRTGGAAASPSSSGPPPSASAARSLDLWSRAAFRPESHSRDRFSCSRSCASCERSAEACDGGRFCADRSRSSASSREQRTTLTPSMRTMNGALRCAPSRHGSSTSSLRTVAACTAKGRPSRASAWLESTTWFNRRTPDCNWMSRFEVYGPSSRCS